MKEVKTNKHLDYFGYADDCIFFDEAHGQGADERYCERSDRKGYDPNCKECECYCDIKMARAMIEDTQMSDYIKRRDAQRALVHTLKDAEIDNACNEQDWYCQGLMDAGVAIDAVPSADVIEVSKILKTADEQEKQGFIQTAKVLRELVSNE